MAPIMAPLSSAGIPEEKKKKTIFLRGVKRERADGAVAGPSVESATGP